MQDAKTFVQEQKRPRSSRPPVLDYDKFNLADLCFSSSEQLIAEKSKSGETYVRVLYALALRTSSLVNTILEIGVGDSSAAFAHALRMAGKEAPRLFSIELDPARPSEVMMRAVREEEIGVAWHIVHGYSLKVPLDQLPSEVDLLYIDGDHGGEHTIGDHRRYAPLVRAGGLIVFDDYPLFPGPVAAVTMLAAEGLVGKKLPYNVKEGNSFYVIRK